MIRYLFKRLFFLFLVVVGVATVVFFFSHLVPSDPARAALGPDATQEMVDHYVHERGLDQPLVVQYVLYLQHVATGDFGTSIVTRRSVASDLAQFIPATIELMIPSLILSVAVGLVLGVAAAVNRNRPIDHISRLISLFGMSMPVFWLGLILQVIFYKELNWLPASGRLDINILPPPTITGMYSVDALLAGQWDTWIDALKHLVLPAFVLSSINLALTARMTRTSLLDELSADYVRTARGKGLKEQTVIYTHALRNAMIPVVTVLGMRIGAMFGGAVLTETVFAWPGIGRYAVNGFRWLDIPVVMGFTLWTCLLYAIVNIVIDVSYFFIDPRVRES